MAAGHLVTAIIGAGVLGLPYAVSWLGWLAGPVCMVAFYVITLWTATMLTDCYHVKGKRHTRYKWAVLHIMVRRPAAGARVCCGRVVLGGGRAKPGACAHVWVILSPLSCIGG